MAVQGVSAAMAGGVSALMAMPLDTIKTRLQVFDGDENNNGRKGVPIMRQTVRNLVREGGWMACYRGLGPRWASMLMSATTMITTYEFLKRLSAKTQEGEGGLNWLSSGERSRWCGTLYIGNVVGEVKW
ncbi:nicotinamide adenine dinucleotide transporter 2, mitochondrial-like [Camellia sinensis]|uniref:nicotinamide adenine dinucleotide transporter 2, mitochondrial-like n=1 Tax=Camellia sinensis TaxID=4442 RepID=UPI001036DADC|nr:nicotinamide adenine dinucleotide transporter 2, mitochondrial-like [Camellia sinensis]